ncbi:L-threonine 3-dehydrogenase [Aureococcus anophagefferens]|nr:L-threonine 3-dehydrogenase [Aureococcus anophagefferens]
MESSITESTALWYVGGRACELRTRPLPEPGANQVLVVATHGAVSRGTETLVLEGLVPASESERMRCPHMDGAFSFPAKYGYVSVGYVARCGAGAEALQGRRVFCLHRHETAYVVDAAMANPIPAGTPSPRAVLAPNLETAINVVWDAKISVGDRVAVVGAGVVGCLVAYVASKIPGCAVVLVDVNPARRRVAERLGVGFRLASDLDASDGDRDVVVHASGHPAGAATALGLAGDEALVVEASWYGARPVALPLGEAFHARRLTLRSSQVGQLPADRRPRWTYARRLAVALDLAADPTLDVLFEDAWIDFDELHEAIPRVCGDGASGLCHRIFYPARPVDVGAGWSSVDSQAKGVPYYTNETAGTTRWKPPDHLPGPPANAPH